MPGLQSDLLLTPRDSQKPPGARQLVPGITCCHPVCREVGGGGGCLHPLPTKVRAVMGRAAPAWR